MEPLSRKTMRGYLSESDYMLTANLTAYSAIQRSTDGIPIGDPAPAGYKYVVIQVVPDSYSWLVEERDCAGSVGSCPGTNLVETYELDYAPSDYRPGAPDPIKPFRSPPFSSMRAGSDLVFLVPIDRRGMELRVELNPIGKPDENHELAWIDLSISLP
ncbi:hypothetical protein JWS13_39075 [Rhodococcus pseudokoreensis]|uniref:Uncharacterized protein n=1 Tax=Rhodococcus pseudokoreensis TaxID=2811421 RepID=A0A974ZXZ4_9NOCA|nr:hypothetical protein [Rhodococcus pseudokoreensis]QSE94181.1 hypothetical protein JWS13_39075 [Rhodococcus pseudokoreensis]